LKNNSANSAPKQASAKPDGAICCSISASVSLITNCSDGCTALLLFPAGAFPLLIFFVNLLGYFATAGSQLRDSLLRYLATVMPYSAVTLVYTTLDEVTANKGGGKLSFSLLAALWVASSGMGAISDTLNVAFNVKETRAWWKSD